MTPITDYNIFAHFPFCNRTRKISARKECSLYIAVLTACNPSTVRAKLPKCVALLKYRATGVMMRVMSGATIYIIIPSGAITILPIPTGIRAKRLLKSFRQAPRL